MQNFYADIDTKVTFNQLDNDGCEIECTVHSKKGHLFYDAVSALLEIRILLNCKFNIIFENPFSSILFSYNKILQIMFRQQQKNLPAKISFKISLA
jgi:hypothetical protein